MDYELRLYNPESRYWYYLLHHGDTVIHVGIKRLSEGHFSWSTSLLRPGVWGKRWPSAEFALAAKPYEMDGEMDAACIHDALAKVEEELLHVEVTADQDSR
jgi:hypothetical protein